MERRAGAHADSAGWHRQPASVRKVDIPAAVDLALHDQYDFPTHLRFLSQARLSCRFNSRARACALAFIWLLFLNLNIFPSSSRLRTRERVAAPLHASLYVNTGLRRSTFCLTLSV